MNNLNHCPCGSLREYTDCCEPILKGVAIPKSAEALMRSRYTAYTRGNIPYIESTMSGKAAENFDLPNAKRWADSVEWLGLTIIESSDNEVEFIASFVENKQKACIYERSYFKRIDGRWFYVDGMVPAVSRNMPCPCGSGKKAKRCCF